MWPRRVRTLLAELTVVLTCAACGGGGGDPSQPSIPTTGSIAGAVRDQNGTGVAGAGVMISATGQQSRTTQTTASGTYSFGSVAAGTWTVTVTPPTGYTAGTGGLTANVNVVAGALASVSLITLNNTNPPANLVDVNMANNAFSPANVTVKVGGTVRWTNTDAVQHNVTGNGFNSANLNQNQTFERQFTTVGNFAYSCTLHAGMNGEVNVVP